MPSTKTSPRDKSLTNAPWIHYQCGIRTRFEWKSGILSQGVELRVQDFHSKMSTERDHVKRPKRPWAWGAESSPAQGPSSHTEGRPKLWQVGIGNNRGSLLPDSAAAISTTLPQPLLHSPPTTNHGPTHPSLPPSLRPSLLLLLVRRLRLSRGYPKDYEKGRLRLHQRPSAHFSSRCMKDVAKASRFWLELLLGMEGHLLFQKREPSQFQFQSFNEPELGFHWTNKVDVSSFFIKLGLELTWSN